MTDDQQLDRNHRLRLANEDRFLKRQERLEAKADPMVGELSSGKFYVMPCGRYRESWSRSELVDFLIRNKYVH